MLPLSAQSRLRLIPITLTQAIGLVCGIASVKLNSHLVPPAILGIYGLFLTFTPVGMWLVYVGVLKYVSRQWAASSDREKLLREVFAFFIRRLPWLALLTGGAAAALTMLGSGDRLVFWVILFFSAALLTVAAFAQTALQAARSHWRDCLVGTVAAITRSFSPPLLYTLTGGMSAAIWLGFGLHAIAIAVTGALVLKATVRSQANEPAAPVTREVYEGSLFTVLAVANLVLLGLNRWLVTWFFGEQEAGYFTLAGSAVVVMTSMLANVIMQYSQPDLFALGDGATASQPVLARRIDQIAISYTAVALVGLVALDLIAPSLVGPLISPTYSASLRWFLPAGSFGIALSVSGFYHTMLLAGRKERACGPVDLITAGLLGIGCLVASAKGADWLAHWLIVSPLVPWLITRTLARRYLLGPATV